MTGPREGSRRATITFLSCLAKASARPTVTVDLPSPAGVGLIDVTKTNLANNAISAFLDNSLHQGNPLNIDPRRIIWKRVLDLNDRALRHVTIEQGLV